jgi:hypothetical protein
MLTDYNIQCIYCTRNVSCFLPVGLCALQHAVLQSCSIVDKLATKLTAVHRHLALKLIHYAQYCAYMDVYTYL